MAPDFLDAHERHWEGAELLHDKGHWANSDHLYGLSAECCVKVFMVACGLSFPRKHLMALSNEYNIFASGYIAPKYQLNLNPFGNWNIGQRYENRNMISENVTKKHKDAVYHMRKILKTAKLDGIIP